LIAGKIASQDFASAIRATRIQIILTTTFIIFPIELT